MSEERSGDTASKTLMDDATVQDLASLDRESTPDGLTPAPTSVVTGEAKARGPRDSSPGNTRRRARTLRIPDDEVARPTTPGASGRSDPPPPVQALPAPPVSASPPPSSSEGAVVTPMRIISIGPPPPDAAPPTSAVPEPPPPVQPPGEDSWTPFQPTVADDALPAAAPAPAVRRPASSDDLVIPIDADVPVPADGAASEPAHDVAIEAGPVSAEPIEPMDDEPVATPVAPPVRALSPTEPEGEEVNFDDEPPTPAVPPVEMLYDGERRSDPGAEIAVEDVVAVEPPKPAPKSIANLPPMRPRLDSKPPLPPPKKSVVAKPARAPLVIVPPHVGTVAPAPSEPGTRRKGRLWWEDLFNDDYLRACERLTDEQIAREVDFVEDSLSIERGGAVLDLACGTGRHSIELARRGYEVVGFDLSLAMLARAGDEAQDRNAKLNFIQGDMREMAFEEQFDGVFCWNTSFGYFDEEKNAQVIDRIHRSLKSEGLLLLDVINRDFIIRQSPSLAWFEGDGCVCMDEMSVDFITSRMKVKRTIMLDDGRSREIEYSMRVYSLHELGRILHEHGFKVCEVSGRIATPSVFFGNESPRTIILAEKR